MSWYAMIRVNKIRKEIKILVKNQDKAVDNKQQVEDKVMKRTIKDSVLQIYFRIKSI